MNYIDTLKDIGLGKNEIKVYISLLQKNELDIANLSNSSKVHRVNTYNALKELKQKGLVIELIKGTKKIYKAVDPKQLQTLLTNKEERLNLVLPQLSELYMQSENQTLTFEGIDGIKYTLNDMLTTNNEILAFGIPKEMPEKLSSMLITFHRDRILKKLQIKHIYNENAKERIKYLKKLKYSDAKYLPPEYDVPATTVIYGDKTAFWIWSETPFCVIIKSEKMASAYKKYFDLLWSIAK
ncbi:MAG: helix-turn-helix domain-containing protein [Candidatus Woesearchaeota archaeon]|jgi:sugar-specific transcriptional regulator TrmB